MKAVLVRAAGLLLGLFACSGQAADEGASMPFEPTLSVYWVVAFMLVFVAVCAWIGIAIWRSERRTDPKRRSHQRS